MMLHCFIELQLKNPTVKLKTSFWKTFFSTDRGFLQFNLNKKHKPVNKFQAATAFTLNAIIFFSAIFPF